MKLRLVGNGYRFYGYIGFALAGVIALASLYNGGFRELALTLPLVALVAAAAWVFSYHSYVQIGPGGLTVVNIFRTHRIPWNDIAGTERRWGLYVLLRTGRKISVWAVPQKAGVFSSPTAKRVRGVRGEGGHHEGPASDKEISRTLRGENTPNFSKNFNFNNETAVNWDWSDRTEHRTVSLSWAAREIEERLALYRNNREARTRLDAQAIDFPKTTTTTWQPLPLLLLAGTATATYIMIRTW
ncbi:hypothetical protein J2S49_001393 [Arcanobacterium wilhelmae]|uniref:Low molecular weight protein antigen 6 PH domain-containing protein n=1 Tax=Arcanobacterium wilhelmae TaxID=1803177 RepID=A0ABT9NCB0_9ACTO|nr:PH domain-containing protein [Arcanobacterium wilhelmae]MDP9801317.1 hypothetical protein [Arcanobacterium wilhelmae]WFN90658.1 PH domain-containing protein [Arcanobacterium wilhelmae]